MVSEIMLKFVLFALVIYKLYDLIRAYAAPMLRERIREIELKHTELISKEKSLHTTKQRHKAELLSQQELLNTLENKVHQWYEIRRQQRDQEEQIINQRMIELKKSRLNQYCNHQSLQQAQETLPFILLTTKQFFLQKSPHFAEIFLQKTILSTKDLKGKR